ALVDPPARGHSRLLRRRGAEGMTLVESIAPGLRRWTAWHEEWKDEVGSLAVDTDEGVVLIDPIDPPRGLTRADHVLLTVFWHGRNTADVAGARVWASKRGARRLGNRGVNVTETV